MKKRILTILLTLAMVTSLTAVSIPNAEATVSAEEENSTFQQELESKYVDPDRVFSTDVRWWLGLASHTDETLLEEIQKLYDGGFRGAELCMQTDVGTSPAPLATYAYGSAMWSHKWKLMINKFLDLGMTVSLTSGTNWATSNVPNLDPDTQEAMQCLRMSLSSEINAGTTFSEALPAPSGANRPVGYFVGAYAVRQSSDNVFDYGSAIDVTSLVSQGADVWTQNLNWTAPTSPSDGIWKIVAYWSQGTAQSSNPAMPDAPCYATNYFDRRGVEALKEFWEANILDDPELNKKILAGDVQLFMDSLEINTGAGFTWWSEGMAQKFSTKYGYDIMPYLFILAGPTGTASGGVSESFWNNPYQKTAVGPYSVTEGTNLKEKIINDWQNFITDLYMEEMLIPLKTWLNEVGIKTRAQISYGKPIEISEPIMAVDYPEAENRNQYNQVDYFRLWTGGAKLQNKLLSTESSAPDNTGYRYYNQVHLRDAYSQYAAGFQRVVWHVWTAEYGYGNYAWPGYSSRNATAYFYMFSNREPSSRNYDEFNGHLGRIQQLMQTGKSRTDIGFVYNKWVQGVSWGADNYGTQQGNRHLGMNWQLAHQGIFYRSTKLQDNGYTYDYFSPEFLFTDEVSFNETTKTIEQAGYKAIVLWQDWLDLKGAEKILEWAKKGLPVVIMNQAAKRTPFNDGKDAALAAVIAELKTLRNVKTAAVNDDIDYFDGTPGGYEDEVYEKLQELGVRPYAEYVEGNHQLLTQTRQDDDGNMYLYAYNYCPNDYHFNSYIESVQNEDHGTNIQTEIKMDGMFIPYFIDAWSGEVTEISNYYYEDGQTVFPIGLDFNNVALFAFEAVDEEKLHIVETSTDSAYAGPNALIARTTKSGVHRTELSNGTTYFHDVTVPTPYDIENWDVNVESWTANPTRGDLMRTETIGDMTTVNRNTSTVKTNINVQLPKMTTWDNMPGVGMSHSGLARYEATFSWDSSTASGAYLDLGDTLIQSMAVWINGKKVGGDISTNPTKAKRSVGGTIDGQPVVGKDLYTGGISWTKPVADIGDYLLDGQNTVVIEYSSNLYNILRSTNTVIKRESINHAGWWGYNYDWNSYGPRRALIIPYMDIPLEDLEYTAYEEFDQSIQYDGAWSNMDSMSFSAKRAKKSTTVGNSATFTFEGRAFQLVSYKSASQGIISISIDGEAQDTVDLYDTGYDTAFGYMAYDSPILPDGKHTVSISIAGKNPKATVSGFYLDAINVAGTLVPVEPIISDSVYQMSGANAATVVTLPAGTDIQITGEPTGGTAVAGNGKIIYTPASFAAEDSITYSVGDQTATVTIQKAAVTRYEETFAGYSKTGTWPSYNAAAYSGGSAYRSATAGSAISFNFTGTGFDVISYKSFTRGTFQVKVEDSSGNTVADKEVDCWDPGADTLFQYPVYKSGALAKDTYKVTITVKANKNVEFDAVDIYK